MRVLRSFLLIAGLAAAPALAQNYCPVVYHPDLGYSGKVVEPYVFILLDTSGTMNLARNGSSPQRQGDDPTSRFYEVKEALHTVLSGLDGVQLGFGTFNQDSLAVGAKHWLYEATSDGPSIPGWGFFPSLGTREVFGLTWACGSGTSDSGVGCSQSNPADLPDAWERERVRRLPKGGDLFSQTVEVYVRSGTTTYKVRYQPAGPGPVGSSTLQTTVTVFRCTSTCASIQSQQTVSWQPVGDFIAWDSAPARTNLAGYFSASTADAYGENQCSGWEPNHDGLRDPYYLNGYNLLRSTNDTDPRGSVFSMGDVIPLDWQNDHREDILRRLAPNQALDPTAAPDFRTAAYFQDQPTAGSLRLRAEGEPPLIPLGPRPLGMAVDSFRSWWEGCRTTSCDTAFNGWKDIAAAQDMFWPCRRHYLLIVTDVASSYCGGINVCTPVAALYSKYFLKTWVVDYGGFSQVAECIAGNARTEAQYPASKGQLIESLQFVFDEIRASAYVLR